MDHSCRARAVCVCSTKISLTLEHMGALPFPAPVHLEGAKGLAVPNGTKAEDLHGARLVSKTTHKSGYSLLS